MSQKLKPIVSYSLLFLAAIVLTGCDNYFGQNKAPSLSGKRISIMTQQRSIEPDSSAAGHKIVLPAPTPNNDWPQAGGYANHAMHHMRIGKALQERWSISVGRGTNDEERLMAQPIVAGNTLFSMDSETIVSAYNLKDGAEIWSVELTPKEEDDDHVNGGLAYENGKVFATTGFGQVVAVAAKTGKVLWRRNVGAPVRSAPTARGNRVFTVTVTNKLFALNGETGAVLWSHSGIEEAINLLGGSSPAVDSGVVIAPYSSGELFALKVENGQELWADSLAGTRRDATSSALGTIRGRPIIDYGIVFAISNSGQFVAINLRTGKRIWERPVGGIESPWIAGDYLFVISNNTDLLALGRLNGRIYWVTALPEWEDPEDREGKITWTGPILASDRLIVAGSSGEALSVSPYSGKVLGKVEMLDSVSISPIVVQDSLLFLSDDAELVAYR